MDTKELNARAAAICGLEVVNGIGIKGYAGANVPIPFDPSADPADCAVLIATLPRGHTLRLERSPPFHPDGDSFACAIHTHGGVNSDKLATAYDPLWTRAVTRALVAAEASP